MHRRYRPKPEVRGGKENSNSKHKNCPAKHSSSGLEFFSRKSTTEDICFKYEKPVSNECTPSKYSSPESTSFCGVESSLSMDEYYIVAQCLSPELAFFYGVTTKDGIFELNQADENTPLVRAQSHNSQNLQKPIRKMKRSHRNPNFLESSSPLLHRIYMDNKDQGVPQKIVEEIEEGEIKKISVTWSLK